MDQTLMMVLACVFALSAGAGVAAGAEASGRDSKYAEFIAAELKGLPGEARLIIDGADIGAFQRGVAGEDGGSDIIDVDGQALAKAIRLRVNKALQPSYLAQIITPETSAAVKKGDVLMLVYHVRCPESGAESGGGHLAGYMQLKRDPWTGTGNFAASPGKTWTKRYFKTIAEHDYAAGTLHVSFHLGQYAQVIELGGVALFNFGDKVDMKKLPVSTINYVGREPDAAWRKEAAASIERHRKGDLTVIVTDGQGKPVEGAQVRARMVRHAYQFGTFLEQPALWKNADGEKYRQMVGKLFTRVTCPLYWADWGWPKAEKDYLALAQWASDNGMHMRGHNLIWPGWKWTPSSLRKLENDPDALRKAVNDSIAQRVKLFARFKFDDYDVINELRDNHQIVDILGQPVIVGWFKLAHELDPGAKMGINEYAIVAGGGHTQRQQEIYAKHIQYLLDNGAPLGVIGFQCHMGEDLTPPAQIGKILDRFARFKLPLHATEFDISTDDEAAQGDYMRDFLTAFFAHPATESITQWGFWEGRHWIPRAALFRKDWSAKPSGQAYMDLVLKQWWTEAAGQTDARGQWQVRGFLGDYEIVVGAAGKTRVFKATLKREGAKVDCPLAP